jgi:ribosomal protein S18 acetylase RimI-like enzyme
MRVRDAVYDDAEAIERVRIRGWQAAYRGIFPDEFLDGLEPGWTRWQERLARMPDGWSIFAAEIGGQVVGFASAGPSRDEDGGGELYALYVDPESWSRGAGRELLRVAEARLAETHEEATLWVLRDNLRARRFYELAGWRVDGAEAPLEFGGSAPAGLRYRKPLITSMSRA